MMARFLESGRLATKAPGNARLSIMSAILLSVTAWPAAQAGIATVALTNDPLPEGNGQFDFFENPSVNAAGQVAFPATLRNTSGGANDNNGLYLHNGSTLVNLARENASVPEGLGLFDDFGTLVLNAAGQVAFRADLKTFLGTYAGNGIYLYDGSALVNLVRQNDAVPEGNGRFAHFSHPVLNAGGQVAFDAGLGNTSGGFDDDSGIYLHNGSALVNLAREDAPVPEGGFRWFDLFHDPVLNAAGQVAFVAELRITNPGGIGLYLHNGTALVKIAREHDNVPEGNGRFRDLEVNFFGLVINAAGQVAFTALLNSTSGVPDDDTGIYLHNGSALVNLVREYDADPEGNGQFDNLHFSAPVLNAAGQVAFRALLRNTSGGTNDDSGIYVHNGSALVNLVRENDAVPEGNGQFGQFGGFGVSTALVFNAGGQVAFSATLRDTSGGTSDDTGIYLTDGIDSVKVAREGDTLAGAIVTELSMQTGSGGEDGRSTSLNDFGQVAFQAMYAGGGQGVFLFTPQVRWRSLSGGSWDTASNWTLSLMPGAPHDVSIDPSGSLTVLGPTGAATVRSLEIGGGPGIATLFLQLGSSIAAAEDFTVQANGVLTGDGVIEGNVENYGTIRPGNLSVSRLTNHGVIRGHGRIDADMVNAVDGEISVEAGERLQFTGPSFDNAARVEATGISLAPAEIEFTSAVTNRAATGLIMGRHALLRFHGGLDNDGVLDLGAFSPGTSDVFGDVTNSIGGTIVVAGNSQFTFYDDVTNNGTLNVRLDATAVFVGALSGNGNVGTGDVQALGDLIPGASPGTMAFGGDLTLGRLANLKIELGGLSAGSQFDQLVIAGDATLAGTLNVSLIDGFTLATGDSFEIIRIDGARSGMFAGLDEGATIGELRGSDLVITYAAGDGNDVALLAAGLPGDYNQNGVVDAADYTLVSDNFGAPAGTLPNDIDGGVIGQAQYDTWKAHFGNTFPGFAALQEVAVPEPATFALVLAVLSVWLSIATLPRRLNP